jgi:hypothetical protein
MTRAAWAQPLCAILIFLLAVPVGFGQTPAVPGQVLPPVAAPPAAVVPPGAAAPSTPPAPKVAGASISIVVLEGDDVIDSIPLLRSIPAVVEVRDSNDYPVEGASVTFTLPAQGPGGTFVGGAKAFTTRSDARGQATSPLVIPAGAGKFQIAVAAASNDRKAQIIINQTNSEGSYFGPPLPPRAWYKRKKIWVLAGAAVVAIVLVVVLTHSSKSSTVVITPGAPVFQ